MTATETSGPSEPRPDVTDVSAYAPHGDLVVVPHGRYEVVLELTNDRKFVRVVEVAVRQDFLSHEQWLRASGYHDVDTFYED